MARFHKHFHSACLPNFWILTSKENIFLRHKNGFAFYLKFLLIFWWNGQRMIFLCLTLVAPEMEKNNTNTGSMRKLWPNIYQRINVFDFFLHIFLLLYSFFNRLRFSAFLFFFVICMNCFALFYRWKKRFCLYIFFSERKKNNIYSLSNDLSTLDSFLPVYR